MLTTEPDQALPSGVGRRFVVVASRYNSRFVDGLLEGAVGVFRASGAGELDVIRVPGSWEIPVTAAVVARRQANPPDAVVCLGVIWQGETAHARHIGDAVSDALMQLALETGIPVVHEVLTVTTEAQAESRCLDAKTNRGAEAARTALEMASLMERERR